MPGARSELRISLLIKGCLGVLASFEHLSSHLPTTYFYESLVKRKVVIAMGKESRIPDIHDPPFLGLAILVEY